MSLPKYSLYDVVIGSTDFDTTMGTFEYKGDETEFIANFTVAWNVDTLTLADFSIQWEMTAVEFTNFDVRWNVYITQAEEFQFLWDIDAIAGFYDFNVEWQYSGGGYNYGFKPVCVGTTTNKGTCGPTMGFGNNCKNKC